MITFEFKDILLDGKDGVLIIKDDDFPLGTFTLKDNKDILQITKLLVSQYPLDIEVKIENNEHYISEMQMYRERRGFTHQQLADLVGCSRQNLVNIENKTTSPKLPLAIKIADVLKMDIRKLL